jgi:hypothetical protein
MHFLMLQKALSRDRFARLHFPFGKALAYRFLLALGLVFRGVLKLPIAVLRPEVRKDVGCQFNIAMALFVRPLSL